VNGLGPVGHVIVDVVVCVGMLVVLPVALPLIHRPVPLIHRPVPYWYAGALPAAVSLWLPRGWPAAALAVPYLLVALALVPAALAGRSLAVATALVSPTVAASALVAERAGRRLFGFELDVLALTVAHFHYAGFVAALVAALVSGLPGSGVAGRLAAWSVPAGIGVVFVGFFTAEAVELAGAVILTAGMWLTGWLSWRVASADAVVRVLLRVSALVLVATMLLALSWAVGEATGLPYPSLSWMAATHGLANAFGFGLCAVFAWRRLKGRPA